MRGDGDGFDAAGERSRHDVGHVRHLGTQTLARLAARAAFHPGGVFGDERGEETSAEIRLHRRSSVSRRAREEILRRGFRAAERGELEERAERNARGAGGARASRGFDEIVEAGHVSHRGHLEEGRQDRDEDGEEERPPVLAREVEHELGAREGVVRDGRVGERERVGVGVGGGGRAARGRRGLVGILGLVVHAVVLVDLLLLAGGDPSAEDVTQHVRVVGGGGGGGVAQREAARAGDRRAADDGERESTRGDGVKRGERRGGRGKHARTADRGGRGVGERHARTRAR